MKLTTNQMIALGILALVLVYAYQQGAFNKDKQAAVDIPTATGGQMPTINDDAAKNAAKTVKAALEEYATVSNSLYYALERLDKMSNADLLAVANAWGRLYGSTEYPTLKEAISQGSTTWIWGDTYNLKWKIVNRLNSLGA